MCGERTKGLFDLAYLRQPLPFLPPPAGEEGQERNSIYCDSTGELVCAVVAETLLHFKENVKRQQIKCKCWNIKQAS